MSGVFLNPGMVTSSARKKVWGHFHEPNIPQISRKNCPRNQIRILESGFLAPSSEEIFSFSLLLWCWKGQWEGFPSCQVYVKCVYLFKHVLIKFITFMTFVMLRGTMRERCPTCWYGATLQITQAVSANFQHSPALKGDEEKYSRGLYWTALSATL